MKLNQALNKKEYYTSSTLKENSNRMNFLSSYDNLLSKIKTKLFDDYDVEDVYITGQILEKQKFFVNTVSIYFEMDKSDFERFVDSHLIERKHFRDITTFIKVENEVYTFDNRWKEVDFDQPIVLI